MSGFSEGLSIECKWQDVGGSADEKYPYLVANIKKRFPCPAIIVVDGGGPKPGAIQWLKSQVDGVKLLHVFNLAEFCSFVNREIPDPVIAPLKQEQQYLIDEEVAP